MNQTEEPKRVQISIKTTEEALNSRNLTLGQIEDAVRVLMRVFGTLYPRLFPLDIVTNEIDRIMFVASIMLKIEHLPGFNRHIRKYDKHSVDNHLFTARTAVWFVSNGYEVELEPEGDKGGGKEPDLRCKHGDEEVFLAECKRIDTSQFYDLREKKELADRIYDYAPTCDQINVYLQNVDSYRSVEEHFRDKSFVSELFKSGMTAPETTINLDNFYVTIIRQPTIIGAEEDFLTVIAEGILQKVETGIRYPSYTFMRGGRSIAIHGPLPDFRRILNRKRSKSKQQALAGEPFVAVICGDDLLGDPASHGSFIENVWLSEDNPEFSGVALLHFVTPDRVPVCNYSANPHALHSLKGSNFEALCSETAPK